MIHGGCEYTRPVCIIEARCLSLFSLIDWPYAALTARWASPRILWVIAYATHQVYQQQGGATHATSQAQRRLPRK